MLWVLAYVACIVLVNVGFVHVPLVELGPLGMWPPMSLAVGAVFVLRDYAQREVGHRVLLAMLVGLVLSYYMASPYVAVASAVAFLVSEGADWLVYTVSKRPFAQRVLVSSAFGTPVDSVVFLTMIGHLSAAGVMTMTLSKMLAALLVWKALSRRVAMMEGER